MKACGLIVEYNPLHNGHIYHIQAAKKASNAECVIAVMSGSFLQRGEPAIIDKFHRTNAALSAGVDIVIELPFPYAVQSSNLFAKGSVKTLYEIGVSSICFGSESGNITNFITGYQIMKEKETAYNKSLQKYLMIGFSFPKASKLAHDDIGLTSNNIDLSKPNNILGFSYVKTILNDQLPIQPLTIKRINNDYHEQRITSRIASATSIRKQLLHHDNRLGQIKQTMPAGTIRQLEAYKKKATIWHTWEKYFPLLHYRVMTTTLEDLAAIQGVDEGLEFRIKETAKTATSFQEWMEAIKTKRYTWTRLQRMFAYILTNTKKTDMELVQGKALIPYIRVLGFTKTGQTYLKYHKKDLSVPIITQLSRDGSPMLSLEEKASDAYYSVVPPINRKQLRNQEIEPPIQRT